MMGIYSQLDKEVIRAMARGKWAEILILFGIPPPFLDGKHHPCPHCGGTNRFFLKPFNFEN